MVNKLKSYKAVPLNTKIITNNYLCYLRFMLILNVILKELRVVIKVVIEVIMLHTMKNVYHTLLAVFLINLCVLIINLANQLFFTEEEMQFINLLKQLLKNMIIAKIC